MPVGSRALVVSASAPVASIVSQLIQGWGATVETVGSVEDALEFARATRRRDVLILCWPGIDSETCQALYRPTRPSC